MMVRDAGFDKARSAAEQNKFCSATHQKKSAARNRKQKISFSLFVLWCATRDLTRHEVPQSRTRLVLQPIKKICGEKHKTKKILFSFVLWCATRDLNPHAVAKEPKSFVSANSTSRAQCLIFYYYTPEKQLIQYQISQIKRQILYLRLVFFQFRYIFYI